MTRLLPRRDREREIVGGREGLGENAIMVDNEVLCLTSQADKIIKSG